MAFNPTLKHLTTRLDGGVVWAASTEYLADNIVIYLDASYRCLVNHTSGSSFVTDLLANKWVKLSASIVNYIANSSALVDTSGYSAYADAAGTAPVDGTGGSPSVTFARSTTTPLRGIADFNFTKPAGASYQGNGVSYDFTIDNADLAKVLSVTFDYEVVSGTYSDGDLTVYLIQDPTGTPTVIQPAGYTILSGTAGTKLTQNATFQTASNVTSYRLCFHCASSTNTSAYVIAMDNISVSPQKTVQGAAISDWQSYTPTITNFGPSGSVTVKGYYRRVGANLEVAIDAIQSANFASSTGQIEINIIGNLGLAFDSSKLATNSGSGFGQIAGTAFAVGYNAGETSVGRIEQVFASTTTVRLLGDDGAAQWNTATAVPSAWAVSTQNSVRLYASVPIAGWSSNTVMSQDTDTRVVALTVSKTTTQSITSAGGAQAVVSWASATNDTHASFNSTTGEYTVPVSGFYRVSGNINFASNSTSGRFVFIQLDGIKQYLVGIPAVPSPYDTRVPFAGDVYCIAGQKLRIAVDQTSGGALNIAANPDTSETRLSISRISGPATIAASESVGFKATVTTTSVANLATQLMVFSNVVYSTHAAYNSSTGVFTAPISGKYQVNASVALTFGTENSALGVTIYKNNLLQASSGPVKHTITQDGIIGGNISDIIQLNAGDTLDIRVSQTNASSALRNPFNSASFINFFSAMRVGN